VFDHSNMARRALKNIALGIPFIFVVFVIVCRIDIINAN